MYEILTNIFHKSRRAIFIPCNENKKFKQRLRKHRVTFLIESCCKMNKPVKMYNSYNLLMLSFTVRLCTHLKRMPKSFICKVTLFAISYIRSMSWVASFRALCTYWVWLTRHLSMNRRQRSKMPTATDVEFEHAIESCESSFPSKTFNKNKSKNFFLLCFKHRYL